MNVVGPGNCWDAYASGIPGGKDFKNLFSILDFPMESLEESEFLEDDWDISKSQCLGPIPSDVLMDPLMETESPSLSTGLAVFIGGTPELHKVPEYIQESSGSGNLQHSSSHLEIPKLKIFQSQRPNSVLESNGSCSNRGTSLKTSATIPVKARSKRVRAVVNPWLALSPFLTSNPKREGAQRKKAVISYQQFAKENKNEKVRNSLLVTSDKDEASVGAKKCAHCEVTKTPQWREGPTGPKTLCNACGVRYRSGRLFPEYRPAASPTFTPALHSNSHKKVIEMRNKANKIDEPPMSPLPEFVPKSSFLFEYF